MTSIHYGLENLPPGVHSEALVCARFQISERNLKQMHYL